MQHSPIGHILDIGMCNARRQYILQIAVRVSARMRAHSLELFI